MAKFRKGDIVRVNDTFDAEYAGEDFQVGEEVEVDYIVPVNHTRPGAVVCVTFNCGHYCTFEPSEIDPVPFDDWPLWAQNARTS